MARGETGRMPKLLHHLWHDRVNMEFAEACAHLYEEKQRCPADDVMSLLLAAEVGGCPLSETALNMWFLTLAQAGVETKNPNRLQSHIN